MTQRKTIFYLIIAFAILVTITALALNYVSSNNVNTIVNTTKKILLATSLTTKEELAVFLTNKLKNERFKLKTY